MLGFLIILKRFSSILKALINALGGFPYSFHFSLLHSMSANLCIFGCWAFCWLVVFFFFFHLLHFSVEFQNDQLVPEQFSLAVLEPSYIMIKKIIGITEMDSFQDRGVISIQNVNGGVTLKMKSRCSLRPFSGQF